MHVIEEEEWIESEKRGSEKSGKCRVEKGRERVEERIAEKNIICGMDIDGEVM